MTGDAKRTVIVQTKNGAFSRRAFAAGATAIGLSGLAPGRALARQEPPARLAEQPQVEYPLTDETVTLRVLAPANALVESFETNDFTAWYEEKTNVHIEWELAPEQPQEAQAALNVRLASGDLPDILLSFNPAPALQMLYGAQGVFLPLNDLIEQHGAYFKAVIEAYPLTRDAITAADGNIYALPQVNDCFHCSMPSKLWIYRPWLEALGLEVPQTTEEFHQVLTAFKEQDPNGNGTDDELPLVSAVTGAHPFDQFFMNAFLFNPGPGPDGIANRLTVQEGTVTAAFATPQWQAGLAYLAGLYADGLIPNVSFTQDVTQLRILGNNPDAVILGSATALFPGNFMDINSLEGGEWTNYVTVPPLAGPDGIRYAAHNPYQPFVGGEFIITSSCENPELALRWADGMYELETTLRSVFGGRGQQWDWAAAEDVGIDGGPAIWKRLSSFGDVGSYGWRQTGPSYRPSELRLGEAIPPDQVDINLEAILYRETQTNYEPYKQPAEMALPPLFFTEEQAFQVAELASTINDYVEQTFASAIIGQFDIEGQWEEYLSTLEGMGLAQYLQSHQEALDARSG